MAIPRNAPSGSSGRTAPTAGWPWAVLALALAACNGGGAPDAGPVGVGSIERAACEHLVSIDPTDECTPGTDVNSCVQELAALRMDRVTPSCSTQYRAWINCLRTLPACGDAGGVLCPSEYAALDEC